MCCSYSEAPFVFEFETWLHAAHQVLVLTHERASTEETLPYLQWLFFPVPVVCLFGRCGAEQPQINKESCVYWGWKDEPALRTNNFQLQLSLSPLPYCFVWDQIRG